MKRQQGFTLIELLVVIAIIAILAAILFPVFAQARESARQTNCLSNQKQLALGILMYANDFDEKMPIVGSAIEPGTLLNGQKLNGQPFNGWSLVMQPYTKNRGMFLCPSMPKMFSGSGACAAFNGQPITNNYAYNYFLGADASYPYGDYYRSPDGTDTWITPIQMSAISQPANTIAFMHSGSVPPYGATWGCTYVTIETPDFYNKIRPRVIHKNGDNLSFTDGHSKWFELKRVDSAGDRPAVYIWVSKGIWTYPFYPERTGGYVVWQ